MLRGGGGKRGRGLVFIFHLMGEGLLEGANRVNTVLVNLLIVNLLYMFYRCEYEFIRKDESDGLS